MTIATSSVALYNHDFLFEQTLWAFAPHLKMTSQITEKTVRVNCPIKRFSIYPAFLTATVP